MYLALCLMMTLSVSFFGQLAHADETTAEKVTVAAKSAKRGLVKGGHRIQEAVCMKGDLKCAADKVENRVLEAKNSTVDGASEVKNKVD